MESSGHLERMPQRAGLQLTGWEDIAAMANDFSDDGRTPAEAPREQTETPIEMHREAPIYGGNSDEDSSNFSSEVANDAEEDFEAEDNSENTETLPNRIRETREFVAENELSESTLDDVEKLAVNFGLDGLSRRYGLEKTLAVAAQVTSKMRKEMSQPRKGLDRFKDDSRFAADAITGIYNQLEPDPNNRKEMYAEMTAGKDNNDKMLLATTLFPDKNGDLRLYRSGESGSLNNIAAYESLRALGDLVEEINNPDSLVFGKNSEQAEAEGRTPTEQLVVGMENPGLLDLLGQAESQIIEGAKLANEQIEAQKKEIESDVETIEKRIVADTREEVTPFETSRSLLAEQIMTMDDSDGRAIFEEASQKMYSLILEKTSEAS